MVNGNGSAVGFFKWAAGLLALALMGVAGFAADGLQSDVQANTDSVANFERRLNGQEVAGAKRDLQLAAIANALQVPVVIDTSAADSLVAAQDNL